MAAVFDVKLDRGGTDGNPGDNDTITNLRFRTDDLNTADTTNPIPIITALTKYSYWRHVYLKCTTAPSTKVDNVKFYTDGELFGGAAGVVVHSADDRLVNTVAAQAGYEVADGTPGDTGVEMVTGHTGVTAKTDIEGYLTGAPKSILISEASDQIDAINEETDYLLLQMTITDAAAPGTLTAETVTFRYDEI